MQLPDPCLHRHGSLAPAASCLCFVAGPGCHRRFRWRRRRSPCFDAGPGGHRHIRRRRRRSPCFVAGPGGHIAVNHAATAAILVVVPVRSPRWLRLAGCVGAPRVGVVGARRPRQALEGLGQHAVSRWAKTQREDDLQGREVWPTPDQG